MTFFMISRTPFPCHLGIEWVRQSALYEMDIDDLNKPARRCREMIDFLNAGEIDYIYHLWTTSGDQELAQRTHVIEIPDDNAALLFKMRFPEAKLLEVSSG
jgi:hypothetical protein